MTLQEGLEILHLDAGANDNTVQALLDSAPSFIETATGMTEEAQADEPLAKTVTGFLIRLWYYGDKSDDVALSRTIDSLLKTIKAKV